MNTKHLVSFAIVALLVSSFSFAQSGQKVTKTTTTTTVTTVTTTDEDLAAMAAPAIAEPKAALPERFSTGTVAQGQTSVSRRPKVAPINEELAAPQPVRVVERQVIVEKPVYVQAPPVYVQTPVYVQEPVYVAPAPVVSLGYRQVGRHGAFSVGIGTSYGSGYGYGYDSGYCYGADYESQSRRLATEMRYHLSGQSRESRLNRGGYYGGSHHGNRQ